MARTILISSGVQSLSKNEGEFRGDLPATIVSPMAGPARSHPDIYEATIMTHHR